ncbi:MAG: DUF4167 domain-containing protein [Sphingopyxis sp.]
MSINNRQQNNGRRRGRSNNGPRQSGGGQSRNYDSSNRIDSRARGNATQMLEKYRNMARDAQLSGDRVMTEYYLQYADHYFRVLSDARVRQEEQRGRFEDRDDPSQGDNESEDQAEELDAIDMIGRAPRIRDDRSARPPREGHRSHEPRESHRKSRTNGHGDVSDGPEPLGIDLTVLPPAIGMEPTREVAPVVSDEEAPAAPKRRSRPRKVVAEGEGAAD